MHTADTSVHQVAERTESTFLLGQCRVITLHYTFVLSMHAPTSLFLNPDLKGQHQGVEALP
jgi:hypothetical protein